MGNDYKPDSKTTACIRGLSVVVGFATFMNLVMPALGTNLGGFILVSLVVSILAGFLTARCLRWLAAEMHRLKTLHRTGSSDVSLRTPLKRATIDGCPLESERKLGQ
jgi:hypothetical protein